MKTITTKIIHYSTVNDLLSIVRKFDKEQGSADELFAGIERILTSSGWSQIHKLSEMMRNVAHEAWDRAYIIGGTVASNNSFDKWWEERNKLNTNNNEKV